MPVTRLALACAVFALPMVVAADMSIGEVIRRATEKRSENYASKRTGQCPPWEPFQCPGGECIPIKYLCDGSRDCKSGYDENDRMCTAAQRPPVLETSEFLDAMLATYGKDALAPVFGATTADGAATVGGVRQLAVALSECRTAAELGRELGMKSTDVKHMKAVVAALANGQPATGVSDDLAADISFYVQTLVETGFLQ